MEPRPDRRRRLARLALAVTALVALAACRQSTLTGESSVAVDTIPERPVLGEPFVVQVVVHDDRNQRPLSGAKVEIIGQMSHPGMAPVVVSVSEPEPGVHRGSVVLDMAGAWVLRVTTTLPDGGRVDQHVEVEIR
ncbi:MAG: FixH family protein [Acidobacteriota bacterium]